MLKPELLQQREVADFHGQETARQVVKNEFTHLDPHLLEGVTLCSEMFVDPEKVQSLATKLNTSATTEILAKTDYTLVSSANSQQQDHRPAAVIEVVVKSYDPATRLFTCRNQQLNLEIKRQRQQLLLETDAPDFVR